MTTEQRDGPTPAGGAYSVAFYHDGHGNERDRDEATHVSIVEYDAEGRRLGPLAALSRPLRPVHDDDVPLDA